MNILKKITAFVSAGMLLFSATALAARETGPVYIQASPSASEKVTMLAVGDDKYNILKNGDFETVSAESKLVSWTASGVTYGESFMIVEGVTENPAPSGKNYIRAWGDDVNAMISYTSFDAIPGETYEFSIMFRCPDEKKHNIAVYAAADGQKDDGSYANLARFDKFPSVKGTDWTEFSYTIEMPEGTARFGLNLRLIGGGEVHWDNAKLVGKLTGKAAQAAQFRKMLADEDAADEATNMLVQGDLRTYDKPYAGQENLIINGSFEDNDGKIPKGWGVQSKFAPFMKVAENASHDGSDCVQISINPSVDGTEGSNPFYTQIVDLVGGAEYQISYWYKVDGKVNGETSGGRPTVKLEYYTDRSLPGATNVGEKYTYPEPFEGGHNMEAGRDGEWHKTSFKIYPQQTVREATVMVRCLTSSLSANNVYFDDIELYMTSAPPAFELDGGWVFYYTDMQDVNLSTNVHTGYYPDLVTAKVDYKLLDTDFETVLWEEKDVVSVDGKTAVSFKLHDYMDETEKPYKVVATLYNADGSVHSVATQNVYMYDRPAYLGKDGLFLKNGKDPVYPIMGYHVNTTDEELEKTSEAVNLIQVGGFGSAEGALRTMDRLESKNMMGLVVLYPGMKCAGNDANIEATIEVVTALKDHPAVLSYIVMDEVFLHGGDPTGDLEASYRLIRSIDKNHPVCVMEAMGAYYAKAAKYVDLLLIDPYSTAKQGRAYAGTIQARRDVQYQKPVYSLLEAYNTGTRYVTPDDGRNSNWQALIAGSKAVGYYSINDSDTTKDESGKVKKLEIWNAKDGGALWDALTTFAEVERNLAYDHYVFNKNPEFNESISKDLWYSSWVDGQDIYMIVLSMLDYDKSQDVSIPLESFSGSVKIGDYTATLLAGRETNETVTGSGTLNLNISGVEALFYKITPTGGADFSALGTTVFEDLIDYSWAREAIGRMDEANVITGRTTYGYAPAEKITRGEFAGFLVRALGLTSDSTDQFADVRADYEFAKEIAIGRALGVLKGTDGVNYNPDAEISRQDLMVICARGMRLKKEMEEGGEMTFSDKDAIADYAVADIAAMVRAGIVAGYTDGTIQPLGNTTRA
ncbi:MAG: S-layer homology domain-containing protein, partial [Clostridia bacterium]|nr:S-layer homology domain-containing protein [Clostridia bacterium]